MIQETTLAPRRRSWRQIIVGIMVAIVAFFILSTVTAFIRGGLVENVPRSAIGISTILYVMVAIAVPLLIRKKFPLFAFAFFITTMLFFVFSLFVLLNPPVAP